MVSGAAGDWPDPEQANQREERVGGKKEKKEKIFFAEKNWRKGLCLSSPRNFCFSPRVPHLRCARVVSSTPRLLKKGDGKFRIMPEPDMTPAAT